MAKAVTVSKNMVGVEWLALIQLVLAYEWLHSAWGKFTQADYLEGMNKTLGFFATKNPHEGYANYLQNSVMPNAEVFGQVVRFSELTGGLLLLAGAFLVWRGRLSKLMCAVLAAASLGLAVMNWNFYMAASHTGPSTAGINVVMGFTELILAAFYAKQALARK
jgi:uncharacterized membrane protein YphA (DoxX/SURF4 family)